MIRPAEYARRRLALMSMMEPGAIAVIPGAPRRYRNRDTEYPFRQDSDFYYLTGFSEPDALLLLVPGRRHGETLLFCQERDPRAELYGGEQLGPERAVTELGVDDAFPSADLDDILPGLLEGRERLYVTLGDYPDFDEKLMRMVAAIRARESGGAVPPGEFVALKHLLHELRLKKSAAELKLMREAARITCAAHVRAMEVCRPGMNETQLEAELLYEFMQQGARHPAYPSIVAGGSNACVLHYVDNDSRLKSRDLVLIDAGCEYRHYAADVTRTFPVGASFSRSQQALYELVLAANGEAIAACTPGAHFMAPHDAAIRVMVQGLKDLKLLEGDVDTLIEAQHYRRFCPHNTSHWLGSDVHDVGDYRVDGAWRALEPGMVLTIEPGIYVPPAAGEGPDALPPRWCGLGIRIEDDVLITAQGQEVLTTDAPKTVADVNRLRRRAHGRAAA